MMKVMKVESSSFILRAVGARLPRAAAAFCALLGFLGATGCGASRTCQTPTTSPAGSVAQAAGPKSASELYKFNMDDFYRQMVRRSTYKKADHPYHVLVLSGGGSNGAWGAGFLVGWGQSGQRPVLDVVTGVSTGALLSTGAFLGDDAMLQKAYTTIQNSDVATPRFVLAVPFSDSLSDTTPLARTIEKFLPNESIDQVAQQGGMGRRLFIGTTNLDSGRLVIWDMTRIAAAHDYGLYRQVVRASCSVPFIYQPIEIDGEMHADGGVRSLLFFRTSLLPKIRLVQQVSRLRAESLLPTTMSDVTLPAHLPTTRSATQPATSPSPGPPPAIYVIVNGKIGMGQQCTADGLLPIALRAVYCLEDANGVADLYQTQLFAAQLGFDFNLSYIPNNVTAPAGDQFNPPDMTRLFEAGRAAGKAVGFTKDIPDLDELGG